MLYRFDRVKDASWNSFERQKERYEIISPFLGMDAVGTEIGVYKGGFGEFLLPHCRKLYLVDPWHLLKPFWGKPAADRSAVAALINILSVYQEEIEAGRVVVVPNFGLPFLNSSDAGSLDWVYLDASHSYEATYSEIVASAKAVRSGGYILGDDFDPNPESNQYGVYKAVNRYVAENGLSLVLNEGRQWGIRIP